MICYFITISLDMFRKKLNKKNIFVLFSLISISQVIISYFIYKQLGIYIDLYIMAYILGVYWDSEKISNKYFINFNIILILSVCTRLIGRIVFDETILYNVLIVGYTQGIIGFSLFFIIYYLVYKFGQKFKFTIVKYLDSVSYEVYLVHYMFIVGPVSLITITSNILINCIIVTICTLILAITMNKMNKLIF